MENTKGIRARLPFRLPDVSAFGGGQSVWCSCSEPSWYSRPATGRIPVSSLRQSRSISHHRQSWTVPGMSKTALSPLRRTGEDTPTELTVDADFSTFSSNGAITLDVLIEDPPVPIRGPYVVETGVFTGESGPVNVGNNEFSNQTWDVRFLMNDRGVQNPRGTAVEAITLGGSLACEIRYDVDGVKLVAVPT